MASFQKTLNLDSLTVNTIYARGNTNSNIPAFRVLTTDGLGGTFWATLSTLQYGGAFHSIVTSETTYTADNIYGRISILNGLNAGLANDPTETNTAYLYANAFGQFDISGGNSLVAGYNSETRTINSNIQFVGTGGINIRGDPQNNVMFFDGRELPFISTVPYSFSRYRVYSNVPEGTDEASSFSSVIIDANTPSSIINFVGVNHIKLETNYKANQLEISIPNFDANSSSTISTLITNIANLNSSIVYDISSFTSPFSSFIYQSISSFSTALGPVSAGGNSDSTISSFITYINQLTSTISTGNSTLNTSSTFIYEAISSFSTALGPVGGGGSGNSDSTISSFITYINELTSTISTGNSTLNTSSTFIYEAISSFSTALGPVSGGGSGNSDSTISSFITYINELTSTISTGNSTINTNSTFIYELISDITLVASTISGNTTHYIPNNYLAELHTSTLYTSSISMAGLKQPFIQYGSQQITGGSVTITLPHSYVNTSYIVQLTPIGTAVSEQPYVSILNNTSFNILTADLGTFNVGWTTFGNQF